MTERLRYQVKDQLQRPVRDLRISVTDRCNFRCIYCMPREVFGPGYRFVPRSELLRLEEISRIANIFAGQGVRKIRITGGEPLIRRDLERLVEMIAVIEGIEDISMTTNASMFAGGGYGNINNLDRGGNLGRQPWTDYAHYSGDIKFNYLVDEQHMLTVALQHYEQEDVARSDRHPNRLTVFEPQQRSLIYLRYQGANLPYLFDRYAFTVSYHRQRQGSQDRTGRGNSLPRSRVQRCGDCGIQGSRARPHGYASDHARRTRYNGPVRHPRHPR